MLATSPPTIRSRPCLPNTAAVTARLSRPKKRKHRRALRRCGVKLVAWGGIEPPTQGFSDAALVKYPAFIRGTAHKCVTCYRPCDRKNTEFRSTLLSNKHLKSDKHFGALHIKHTCPKKHALTIASLTKLEAHLNTNL
jgi:hypothetical protein